MDDRDETVIRVAFGKETREAGRALSRLLGIVEAQEAELLSDPRRLFALAQSAIAQRDRIIREAQDALRPRLSARYEDPAQFRPIETVNVMADEYRRLKAAAEIIQRPLPSPAAEETK
jgi:hypothetical protein